MRGRKLLARGLALSLFAALVGAVPALATSQHKAVPTRHVSHVSPLRTVDVAAIAAKAHPAASETGKGLGTKVPHWSVPKSGIGGVKFSVPRPRNTAITTFNSPNFHGHDAISAADSRLADNGNQFTVEPSDMALCTGGTYVVEVVNDALQIYTTAGAALIPVLSQNQFFGLPPAIDRSTGTFPGPFMGDAQCEYDQANGRFIVMSWALDQDPTTGNLTLANWYYIAVSDTSSPLGTWTIYKIDAASTFKPQCPCEGDHPLMGLDANVLSITDNEFDFFTGKFYGAQLHLLSIADIEAGAPTPVVQIAAQHLSGNAPYSLQPANIPPGGSYETASGGALYYASALEFNGTGDNRIAIWALVNTSAIDSNPNNLVLSKRIIGSEVYFTPQKMMQKPGHRPLGLSVGEPRRRLDGGGDETQPTTFVNGRIWTSLDTLVGLGNTLRDAVAWFKVDVSLVGTGILAEVTNQGYVAVLGNNLDYGAVTANSAGQAVLAGSLVGPDYWPSTFYGFLDPTTGLDAVHIAGAGAAPEDGFTCYAAFVGDGFLRGCRWGDYSDANVGADGNFYFSTQYITDRTRVTFANWGSFWSSVPFGG